MTAPTVRYIVGDTRDVTRTIPDGSVDLIITSPPFLALRSYLPDDHPDKHRELGSEPNPAAFIDMLLTLTAEWRRVLAPHGTLAVELGDTYSSQGQTTEGRNDSHGPDAAIPMRRGGGAGWPLAKCQALIPELYRVALAYGINPLTGQESPAGRWRVRNTVTWCRPNPPVGSLGDKFRPSTSDLVIACTSERRWFDLDAVRVPFQSPETHQTTDYHQAGNKPGETWGNRMPTRKMTQAGAPPLDHWIIPPGGYTGSHYAVFPPALLEKPIEACCPRRVCVTCGTPSRRLVDTELVDDAGNPTTQGLTYAEGTMNTKGNYRPGHVRNESTTIGWTSCDCPGTDGLWDPGWRDVWALARAAAARKGKTKAETEEHKAEARRHYATLAGMYHGRLDGYHTGTGWRPGHVLDPFGGSGTTGLVAQGRARDCTLIDLDERNADLARERLGMFLDIEVHS